MFSSHMVLWKYQIDCFISDIYFYHMTDGLRQFYNHFSNNSFIIYTARSRPIKPNPRTLLIYIEWCYLLIKLIVVVINENQRWNISFLQKTPCMLMAHTIKVAYYANEWYTVFHTYLHLFLLILIIREFTIPILHFPLW